MIFITIYFGLIFSGVTLFVELERKEFSSMPGDKMLMPIGVIYLVVTGVYGVPGVVVLGFPRKNT